MTFRDGDDDTSSGRTTQGGGQPRRGAGLWLVLTAIVVVAASLAIWLTTPRRFAPAEQGTTPLSSGSAARTVGSPSTSSSSAPASAPSR